MGEDIDRSEHLADVMSAHQAAIEKQRGNLQVLRSL